MKLNTCHHSFDNGSFCKSPALRGRDYCCYHLNHRGRLMRIARKRAQNERLFLTLPPLENMHAVQSALSQVLEAVAADMIDLKRAQFLLTGLRHAASNFKNPKAWQTQRLRQRSRGTRPRRVPGLRSRVRPAQRPQPRHSS